MSKVYLLFQWTEEREAKNHIGVYSTLEKARAAAQLDADQEAASYGAEPEPLNWADLEIGQGSAKPSWYDTYEDGGIYDIEAFDLDTYTDYSEVDWSKPEGHPAREPKVHEL